MNDVLDGGDAADRFLGEDAEFERKRPGKFAFEIDRATAHPRHNPGVLHFWPFELHENDGLAGAQKIGHDADYFEVEFLDLVAGEYRIGIALHAGTNLA